MKTVKPLTEQEEEHLPFSFLKPEIDEDRIKEHWQGIKDKIQSALPELPDSEDNN